MTHQPWHLCRVQCFTFMPIDALSVLSAASGSTPTAKDFFNSASTMMTNYMNQKFSERMYERQRKDTIEFWNMQNAYNDPTQQMARLRNAGLNPHLIYGSGGGANNAGPLPTPDMQHPNFREPRFEGGRSLMPELLGAADLDIKAAQADNLRAQNEEIRQNTLLKSVQAERAGFDLAFERRLEETSADYRRENLRKMKVDIDYTMQKNVREAVQTSSNVTEALERVLNLREQRKNLVLDRTKGYSEIRRINAETDRLRESIGIMKKDGSLRDIEIKLREAGINPNDPMWERYIGLLIQGIIDHGASFMNSLPKAEGSGSVNYRPDFGPKH